MNGIIANGTTATVPIVLLEGIMRLDGDDHFHTDPYVGGELEAMPIYASPLTNGKFTADSVEFAAGNVVHLMGYILGEDSNNASGEKELFIYFKPDVFYMEL